MASFFKWVVTVFAVMTAAPLWAQAQVWVQVEAVPTLREAQERARSYATIFPNIAGFATETGWYVLALGPYEAQDAEIEVFRLKDTRAIPRDSYISDGSTYGRRIWPLGAADVQPGAAEETVIAAAPVAEPVTPPAAEPLVIEETRAEARRSEAELGMEDRKDLQRALKWEGFYTSAIDGAFGPGTRNSMAAWQEATGHEVTGVLTTLQRGELLDGYREAQEQLGLRPVTDTAAGITLDLPMNMVAFDHYEPPFVHYKAKGDSDVQVLLISQQGDQATLFGLYEIMQTLEIVPLGGTRERNTRSFTLTGQDSKIISHTYAELNGGFVKGYTLIWPANGDARLRQQVLDAMAASFAPDSDRALDASLGQPSTEERAGLLSGLEVRRPEISRSGFYIDGTGTVLTTDEVLAQCDRITLDGDKEAEVVAQDRSLGLAVLKPKAQLSPIAYGNLQSQSPRLNAEVAVAGFSYEDALDEPVMTFGALADTRGLSGEATLNRLAMATLPGDAGGPVFDSAGSVIGMLMPRQTGGRILPDDVSFAVKSSAIAEVLAAAGIITTPSTRQGAVAAEDLTALALDMTVKVSCWK